MLLTIYHVSSPKRLRNSHSKRPKTTMSTGLPERALGETHTGKSNVSLGQRSPTLQVRTRMLCSATSLPSSIRDSTRVGHWHIHVIVGHTEDLRLPIKIGHQASMNETGNTTVHHSLHHCGSQRRETLIRSPAAFTACAKQFRKAMPPAKVDENLPSHSKRSEVPVRERP